MKLLKKIIFRHCSIIFLLFIIGGHAAADERPQILSKQRICAEGKKGVTAVSPAALKARLDAGEKFVLLDIRTEAEYRAGYISGAVWMPRGMLELKLQEFLPDPETEIIIYCGQECRGYLAAKTLAAMGYKRVSNLIGGVKDWTAAGYPLYNTLGEIRQMLFGVPDPGKKELL